MLVTHHYPPEHGAPQRRWGGFVARFVEAGARVTVLTPSPHYPSGLAGTLSPSLRPGAVTTGRAGETVHRLAFRAHDQTLLRKTVDQSVAAAHALVRGASRFRSGRDRPDVVVATAPGLPSIPAGLALGAMLRRPVVTEIRDAWPDLIAPSGMWGQDRGLRSRAVALAHGAMTTMQRRSDAIVTTTASFGEVLIERGMPTVRVIRNGVPFPDMNLVAAPEPHGAGLRVLYLGTLGRAQGLVNAIEAAEIAHAAGVDVELRIVGSGSDEHELAERAQQSAARVSVLPRVAPEEVGEHYAWADTCLVSLRSWLPMSWTVPSKLYEILAVGRHVSASVTGEAARIVEDSGAGDVVPPEDPARLATLWQQLARDRGRLVVETRARNWVAENADLDRLAASYLDLLESVSAR
jgi:colanic acid biosynthesis glycosyl transferase WcaI